MKIYINDTAIEVEPSAEREPSAEHEQKPSAKHEQEPSVGLTQALDAYQPEPPYAVAVNGQFIPRGQYEATELADGDRIDLVSPRQGG